MMKYIVGYTSPCVCRHIYSLFLQSNPGLVDFLAEEEVLPSAHKLSLSLWQKQQFTVWLKEEACMVTSF